MNTYYDIFGISPSATQAEIKIAYHKLALKYHPDRNLNKELGDSKMKEINFIYSILSNPEKRKWYDSTTTYNKDYEEQKEHIYSFIFRDEIEVTDSKGTKTKLKVGDTIYYLVEIDKSIITWKYKRKEYFNLIIKNIFDPEEKDSFINVIKFDFNKTPLCTAHWGNSEMIIYKEDFENYWLSQESYSKLDKRKGVVSGIFIFILFVLGVYYFYTKFSFSADFYFKKGKAEYIKNSDTKNALIHLNKAIELNPNYTEAYLERGLIKFRSKDYKGSIKDLNKAIEIKPSDSAYGFRAMIKYFLEDFKGVIDDCDRAIALKPSRDILVVLYNYKGQAEINTKDYDGALRDFNKAIETYPSSGRSYNNKAIIESYLNKAEIEGILLDHESAIKDLSKVIELDSTKAEAYLNRGLERISTEDYKEAIEDFNKAIKLNPSDAITFAVRAFTKDNLGDYTGAIKDYNKAIELNPSNAQAYLNRGSVEIELNQKKEACIDFHKAKDLGDEGANELIKKHCNE